MQHRLQWFNAVQTFKRAAVLCVVLPLAAQAAQAQGRVIYPDPSVAKTEIHQALVRAKAQHKRVILDFGGNWCGDCQVLDIYFHNPQNRPILDANYVLVHVNIGHIDQNQDIAARYEIPLNKGVPAVAVLDSDGKLLYSQKGGEFEAMRHMQSSAVKEFLTRWKPGGST